MNHVKVLGCLFSLAKDRRENNSIRFYCPRVRRINGKYILHIFFLIFFRVTNETIRISSQRHCFGFFSSVRLITSRNVSASSGNLCLFINLFLSRKKYRISRLSRSPDRNRRGRNVVATRRNGHLDALNTRIEPNEVNTI